MTTAVQVSNLAFGLDVVSQTLHIRNDHFSSDSRREERSSLGTPVIVYGKAYNAVTVCFAALVHDITVQIGYLREKSLYRILLILVDQSHGSTFEIHERNPSFIPASI